MSKIAEFKKRNQKRNAHLYHSDMVENVDYIVCPVSEERLSMIKRNYIEKVLDMSVDDYDRLYPGARQIAPGRKVNISRGLAKIDPVTGKTKHQLSVDGSKRTLSEIDPVTGMNGYATRGLATKAGHLSNIDEAGRNGFQRLAHYRVTTILETGETIEQRAHKRRLKAIVDSRKGRKIGASAASKNALAIVIGWLNEHHIKYYWDKTEYGINDDGKYYFFDLTIPVFNLAIEYQSFAFHSDPFIEMLEWSQWKCLYKNHNSQQVHEYDFNKSRALHRLRGFATWHIWERTEQHDVEVLMHYLQLLHERYTDELWQEQKEI